jgi:hypothetical protein
MVVMQTYRAHPKKAMTSAQKMSGATFKPDAFPRSGKNLSSSLARHNRA